MEDFLLWLLLFSCLCLAANAGRGRLSGGRERGACHFWSHSAIQRKPSLKSPGNSNLPSARHRGQQGRAGLSGLCPSQGFPHRGSEAWREVCLTVGPSGEAGALGALGTQQAAPSPNSPAGRCFPVSHFGLGPGEATHHCLQGPRGTFPVVSFLGNSGVPCLGPRRTQEAPFLPGSGGV